MIFDNIKNRALYERINDRFALAFDFIEKVTKEGAELGRYELLGKELYAMVQEYEPNADSGIFEAHKNYIDIQYILSGKEYMECAKEENCEIKEAYDASRDIALYTCEGYRSSLDCEEGDFAIFFPHDIHKPGVKLWESGKVRKIVVKVRVG